MLFVRPVHTCSSGPVSTTGARRLHWGFIFDSSELTNALRQSFTKVKVLSPPKLSSLEKPIEAEDTFLCWKVAFLPKQTFFPVTGRPENMAYFPCMVLCSQECLHSIRFSFLNTSLKDLARCFCFGVSGCRTSVCKQRRCGC